MKAKALLLVFVLCSGPISLAQKGDSTVQNLQFYERLAQRDAAYEQTVQFSNELDEHDYWNDQKNFEKLLLQNNPKAYQVYINSKRPSYIDHIQQCLKKCAHGDFYRREVAFFLLKTSQDPMEGWSLSNTSKKEGIGQF